MRKTRNQLVPKAPPHVLRMTKELRAWRLAVLSSRRLTGRDKMIAAAHAHAVEQMKDGVVRVHFRSNGSLAALAGYESESSSSGRRAAQVANAKLVELGFIERVSHVAPHTTHYTFLLTMPF